MHNSKTLSSNFNTEVRRTNIRQESVNLDTEDLLEKNYIDNVLRGTKIDFASMQTERSHVLLKVPFLFLACCTGLWPTRWKGIQIFLVIVSVAINSYILLGNIAVYNICGNLPEHVIHKLKYWLCYENEAFNRSSTAFENIFRPVLIARASFAFSQFCGYILMVYSVLICMKSRENRLTISLPVALTLLTRRQWIRLNLQIALSFVIWLTFLICDIHEAEKYIPFDHAVIWSQIGIYSMWFHVGAPCWIFAVMTYALESLIKAFHHEIEQLQNGKIEDVIVIYRQLCKNVFCTVNTLRFWFVVHWMTFGVVFVLDISIGFKAVEVKYAQKQNQVTFWLFSSAFLSFVLHPFLYPSLRAASLTSTSGDMLERLNFLELRDNHPLKSRRDMNEFLMFASHAKCGFRIGRSLTFDTGLAWLSIFIGTFGLTKKLM